MPSEVVTKLEPVVNQAEFQIDAKGTGALVSNTREKLNISQKALALEMEISQSYLSDLESGNRHWTMTLFRKAKLGLEALTQ